MKKHNLILSVCFILVIFLSSVVLAGEKKKIVVKPMKKDISTRDRRDRRERRKAPTEPRMRDRRGLIRINDGVERRQKQNEKFIAELKAVKELALKEGAKKTAKRLEAIIKVQEKRSKKAMDNILQSREHFRERFTEKDLPNSAAKKDKEKAAEPVKKAEPGDESKDAWWQFWK